MTHTPACRAAQVEAGWNALLLLEEAGSDSGTTSKPCEIVDCGELALDVEPNLFVKESELAALAADAALSAEGEQA